MLIKTNLHFNINPIIKQVTELSWDSRSIQLNETTGHLLNGIYVVKPEFIGTPLGDVLTALGDIGEARLLKIASGETYTAHTDPDDRFHLSIISNEFCYLANLEEDTLHHLPVDGYVWEMDTSIKHSAINLGGLPRIQLNIRKRLPAFTAPGMRLEIVTKGFAWKQDLYIDTMGYINSKIKSGEVTGFTPIDDKVMLINCSDAVLNYLTNIIFLKGCELEITPELPLV